MRRVLIFGNSGSGKSTLAKRLSDEGLAHLDLDTVAWDMDPGPERSAIEESGKAIGAFLEENEDWVIEGCYADLMELVIGSATEVVFMNLSVEHCINNARSRPWERHKYESKEAQDKNLEMLIGWIADYPHRNDVFSRAAHMKLYEQFKGSKRMVRENLYFG